MFAFLKKEVFKKRKTYNLFIRHSQTQPHAQTDLIRSDVSHCQLRLIIQHLLKVGHMPRWVCRVPMKTLKQAKERKWDRQQWRLDAVLYCVFCPFITTYLTKPANLPDLCGHEFPLKPSFWGCEGWSAVPPILLWNHDLQTSMTSGTSGLLEWRNNANLHLTVINTAVKNTTAVCKPATSADQIHVYQ